MDARDKIATEAESWLLTPWRHMGEIKGAGVDCAQYLKNVYVNAGLVEWFDTGFYPPDWMMHREEERFLGFVLRYAHEVEAPQRGDAAVFKVGHCYSHGAIVLEWPRLIHAFLPERAVVYGDASYGFLKDRPVRFFSVL